MTHYHTKHCHAAVAPLGGLLLLFNTMRMVPGPPSTGVAIAMDGGMGHGRHSLLVLHRPLIGEESEGGSDPSLYSRTR